METFMTLEVAEIIGTIFYTILGVILMGACWWAINKFTHFSVIREIEEDQNVALAVLIGSVFLSLSLIIAAVILS